MAWHYDVIRAPDMAGVWGVGFVLLIIRSGQDRLAWHDITIPFSTIWVWVGLTTAFGGRLGD